MSPESSRLGGAFKITVKSPPVPVIDTGGLIGPQLPETTSVYSVSASSGVPPLNRAMVAASPLSMA